MSDFTFCLSGFSERFLLLCHPSGRAFLSYFSFFVVPWCSAPCDKMPPVGRELGFLRFLVSPRLFARSFPWILRGHKDGPSAFSELQQTKMKISYISQTCMSLLKAVLMSIILVFFVFSMQCFSSVSAFSIRLGMGSALNPVVSAARCVQQCQVGVLWRLSWSPS